MDDSKAVPLLQFVFDCAFVISFMAFVLSLFVTHLYCFFFFLVPRKDCAS